MNELSDQEIEEAAREAGISPAELRAAMSERDDPGGALAHRPERGVVGAPTRGVSVAMNETNLPLPPEAAVRSVKKLIEAEIGSTGHMMGSTEADIYDEPAGVVYRVKAADDGSGGAMVRVDIDPTPLRSRRTLSSMALGATVGLFAVTGLIIPGLLGYALLAGAVGLTALGATSMVALRNRVIKDAGQISAHALIEAEHRGPIGGASALPPAPHDPDNPYMLGPG